MNPAKASWGVGPWLTEPDHAEWRAHGFPCLMHRHPSLGHWCGYVGVPPGHPWHGTDYDAVPAEAHGGGTYAQGCEGEICHVPQEGESDDVWWVGFDCAHLGDLSPGNHHGLGDERYRTEGYVRRETNDLARQARDAV